MRQTLLLSEEAIAKNIKELAAELNTTFSGKEITIVCVLKGAICLTADLMRQLEFPTELECIQAKSYGMRGTTPGDLTIQGLETLNLQNKNILLIDDIFDTGQTLNGIVKAIQLQNPKSITTLVLLKKKDSSKNSMKPNYVCFDIENHFVIGYGLDYKQKYRGLKGIYILSL